MAGRKKSRSESEREARNEDPLTGEPGSHPVGSGVGSALGGAAAGAAAGALGGPGGAIAGAVVGGIAGGLVGKSVAENIDPTVESAYWRENFRSRPYYTSPLEYDDYEPAYQLGWSSYEQDQEWEDREPMLRKQWEEQRWTGVSRQPKLDWDQARPAVQDAYQRAAQQRHNARAAEDTDALDSTERRPTSQRPR